MTNSPADDAMSDATPNFELTNRRYARSERLLERARRTIPIGAQTFSKSITQFPHGISPYFVTKGRRARVWDVDGNEYVDFINALNAIILGYDDPDVMSAVRAQLEDGTIFSLSHPLEVAVAEKIRDLVPCAEMVRFGKNGSDATAAAVRLARAFTGREHVAVAGYHGWQDWYIASTTRDRGVPVSTQMLVHRFTFNELASLERVFEAHPDAVALVILEPMNAVAPAPGFLEGVVALAHERGALVAFDEMITGFRFANGGAQELFGVTPDLATLGKGMANGYPLSAIVGRADVMALMEEVFFSFTFGGETLSLAAALATMQKFEREPVVQTLADRGREVVDGVSALIERHGLGEMLEITGHPSWSFLVFHDAGRCDEFSIRTLFLQEVFARGVLTLGTHNMSYAHGSADVERLLTVYDEVFPILRRSVDRGTLVEQLRCDVLKPLFKLR